MTPQAKFFKIGLFVTIGLILILIAILTLSTAKLFERPTIFETYFDESVDGIELGTPVKFRGVKVGTITKITFVGEVYPELSGDGIDNRFARYIYVRMALDLPFITGLTNSQIKRDLRRAITQGLRIRLTPKGLTGTAVLELNYFDAKRYPLLLVTWEPDNYYIPSIASTFTQLAQLLGEIHKANLPKFFTKLTSMVDKISVAFEQAKIADLSRSMRSALTHVSETAEKMNQLLLSKQFNDTFGNLNKAANRLSLALDEAPQTMRALHETLNKTQQVLATQQSSLQMTLGNLQMISQNLRNVSDMASKYPSQLILGDKPPRINRK